MEFKSQDAQNIYKSNRLLKVLRVISLLFGIGCLVFCLMRLLMALVSGDLPFLYKDSMSIMFNSHYFAFIPGILLMIGASNVKKNELDKAMRFFKIGTVCFLLLIFCPIWSVISGINNYPYSGMFDTMIQISEIFQLLIYPIFFFIVKKRLSRMNHS